MDIVSSATRSRMMSGIRSANTRPEKLVRKYLHSIGFRFRLSTKQLNCKPDIILPKYRVAILVHGCFWHRHENCKYATTPKSNGEKWARKFTDNLERDLRVEREIIESGWRVVTIWECWSKRKLDLFWLREWITLSTEAAIHWPEIDHPS